ncbi:MAG: exopolysaccharide Pel transporter PelG, partial [Clostridiales bacterium]
MIILAGIGFELRKLIKKDDKLSYIKTYLFSSIVTIGPTVLCIMLITFFQILMLQQNVKIATREFYMAATMYCFIFSIIIVGVFNMPLSRYVSDLIFEKKREKILPSMFGTIIACIVLGGVICVSFLWGVNCTFLEKLLIYLLFVVLIIIWVEMIFISAIDDYKSVIRGFSIGVSIGVITALILTIMNVFKISYVLFFSNVLTFTIIAISFMITLLKILNFSIKYNYFEFIKSIDKHKKLIITSFLLTLSVYTHNFVFWFSEVGITVKQVLHFAPNYDIATFFAFLSVMPSLVIFVVSMETSFYTGFKRYLSKIENG